MVITLLPLCVTSHSVIIIIVQSAEEYFFSMRRLIFACRYFLQINEYIFDFLGILHVHIPLLL